MALLGAYALLGVLVISLVSFTRLRAEAVAANQNLCLRDIEQCLDTAVMISLQDGMLDSVVRGEASSLLSKVLSRCDNTVATLAADPAGSRMPGMNALTSAIAEIPRAELASSMTKQLPASAERPQVDDNIAIATAVEMSRDIAKSCSRDATAKTASTRLTSVAVLGGLFLTYVLGLLRLRVLYKKNILAPMSALTNAVRRTVDNDEPLELPSDGPQELHELTSAVSTVVNKLEDDAREQSDKLNAANNRLRQTNVTLRQTRQDAYRDALTKLPNRYQLTQRLTQLVEQSKRDSQFRFAVLFLDLDNFKHINDSLGHNAGDLVLSEVATRLEACLRALDSVSRRARSIAGRLGGDEFVILLQNIRGTDEAISVAERVQEQLRCPLLLEGHEIALSASIGIRVSDGLELDGELLLRDADTAMYRAKQAGKIQYVTFDQSMHDAATRRFELENQLRQAVERDEFVLEYQPIVNLDDGTLHGFEALIRWENPVDGRTSPDEFIPLAEETGLILPIGTWVLNTACKQLRAWQVDYGREQPIALSVNVSKRQLDEPGFVGMLHTILTSSKIEPGTLNIELTEGIVLDSSDEILAILEAVKDLDVKLHLDDFGTGYATLGCLRRYPFDTLKIDRTFVQAFDEGSKDACIVAGVVSLARALGMNVIAEGIEDDATLAALTVLRCGFGQGYYFSKPVSAEQATEILTNKGTWLDQIESSDRQATGAFANLGS